FLDVAIYDAAERHLSVATSAVDWGRVCLVASRLNVTKDYLRRIAEPLDSYRPNGIYCDKERLESWLKKWDRVAIDNAWQKWLLSEAVRDQGKVTALGTSLKQLVEHFHGKNAKGLVLAF